eukprot:Em0023g828a
MCYFFTKPQLLECALNQFTCADGLQCVGSSFMCHCHDGSDEMFCNQLRRGSCLQSSKCEQLCMNVSNIHTRGCFHGTRRIPRTGVHALGTVTSAEFKLPIPLHLRNDPRHHSEKQSEHLPVSQSLLPSSALRLEMLKCVSPSFNIRPAHDLSTNFVQCRLACARSKLHHTHDIEAFGN